MGSLKFLSLPLVLAAVSCSHVPLVAQEQQRAQVAVRIITPPEKCEEEGGCMVVSFQTIERALRAAEARGPSCRRGDHT